GKRGLAHRKSPHLKWSAKAQQGNCRGPASHVSGVPLRSQWFDEGALRRSGSRVPVPPAVGQLRVAGVHAVQGVVLAPSGSAGRTLRATMTSASEQMLA